MFRFISQPAVLVGLCAAIGLSGVVSVQADTVSAISGLVLRLDAGQNVTTGTDGRVTAWDDVTDASNNTVAQNASAAAGAGPTVSTLGGKPALDFTGGKSLSNSDPLMMTAGSARTIFVVAQASHVGSYGDGGAMLDIGNAPTRFRDELWQYVSEDTQQTYVYTDSTAWSRAMDGTPALLGSPFISAEVSPGAGPKNSVSVALNGTTETLVGGGVGTETSSGYTVSGSGLTWNGKIAEVLVYDRVLDPTELNTVGYYLQDKYGVSASYIATPEPGTLVLLATGLIALLCYAWRRRR